jgi:hypothetical protein
MIDSSPGPGRFKPQGHTPSAGERWSRGPGSDRENPTHCWQDSRGRSSGNGYPLLVSLADEVDAAPLRGRDGELDQQAVEEGWEETVRQHRRIGKRRRRCWRPIGWRADTAAPVNIDTLRPDFLLGAAGKARSLRFSRPEITRKLFAIQARMERQFTGTAAPSVRPPAKGRNLVGTRIFCGSGSRNISPPHDCAWGGAVAPTSHFPKPVKTTRGEVVLSA